MITEFEENGWRVIQPSGNIQEDLSEKFRLTIKNLMDQGCQKFRFDFSNVQDINAEALSVLIIMTKKLSETNNELNLEVIGANQNIENLFRVIHLDEFFKMS